MPAKISALKKYFKKEPSVVLAFLFGSYARGKGMKESDVDIAVYLKGKDKFEKVRGKIWLEVSKIIKKEVDLIVLNEAPASLVSDIFKTGLLLINKDKKLYWEIYLEKSLEAEDFLRFAEDFFEIYKKAKSLTPEQKIKALERFKFLDTEIQELKNFGKLTFREYRDDKIKKRNIERWVETILNALIDISKIVLASEKKRMSKSYEEALFDFILLVGFEKAQAEDFSKFADLRNILTHEYLDILYGKIQNFIKELPEFYQEIFNFLENYLKNKTKWKK